MDLHLKNKTVVVTGGSKGIGYAIAKCFLEEGARVAICARDAVSLEQAANELSALGSVYWEAFNVTSAADTYAFAQHVFEKFGSIDVWVNNVGASVHKSGDEYSEEQIDYITGILFKSVIFGCQAAFRYMKQQRSGAIVNISSLAARCASAGKNTLYGPLKSAINNLTNTLAGEYCAYNVRVTCVMPGFTKTPLVARDFTPEELQLQGRGALLNRLAMPEEIARPVVFLASDAASYMTATAVEVSGGRSTTLNPTYAYDKLAAETAGNS